MGRPRPEGPFRRGVFKYIILRHLKERPGYGYEIIRALEERFHGLYVPSAGTVYPTLQMIEEMGFVTSNERDGKKVYTITAEGLKFLDEHQDLEQEIKDRADDWGNPRDVEDIRKAMHEYFRLGEALRQDIRKMGAEKLGQVREILSRANKDIENILKT
jgi:DNA-binding PadR family transcriptional regulator